MNKEEQKGKVLTGTVTSTGMAKTVTVKIRYQYRHPLYKKAMNRSKSYAVHNEIEGTAVGDEVVIKETRPVSRRVHFTVIAKK